MRALPLSPRFAVNSPIRSHPLGDEENPESMAPSPPTRWTSTLSMPRVPAVEYKYVINRGKGLFKWEDDIPNRLFVPREKGHSLLADGAFDHPLSPDS